MQKIPLKISFYITKIFLYRLAMLILALSFLIFIINIMEVSKTAEENGASYRIAFEIVLFQIPKWIELILPFLVMIASLLTFNKLSMSSELAIIRSCGVSIWQFLLPVIVSSMLIGIMEFSFFNSLSAKLNAKGESLYALHIEKIEKENMNDLAPRNGIWFRQQDITDPNGEIIFQAQRMNKGALLFKNVAINYLDENKLPIKRINAAKMLLNNGSWELENITILEEGKKAVKKKSLLIPTDIKNEFILSQINNKYEKAETVGFWELPRVIHTMESSGLSSQKFRIQFYSLLTRPILFLAIVLISSYFSLNHSRSNKNTAMLTFGIIAGFFIYFTSDIMFEFGKIEKIPFFVATWLMSLTYLIIGFILVAIKEE